MNRRTFTKLLAAPALAGLLPDVGGTTADGIVRVWGIHYWSRSRSWNKPDILHRDDANDRAGAQYFAVSVELEVLQPVLIWVADGRQSLAELVVRQCGRRAVFLHLDPPACNPLVRLEPLEQFPEGVVLAGFGPQARV